MPRKSRKLLDEFETIVSRVNAIVVRAESDSTVQQEFVAESGEKFRELEPWREVFDVLFVHAAFLMELSQQAESSVVPSPKQLANRLSRIFDRVDPTVGQHLYDGHYLSDRSEQIVDEVWSITTRSSEDELSVDVAGIQAVVLYTLVQKVSKQPNFLEGLQDHTRYSEDAVRTLLEFALNGENTVLEYELAAGVQWQIALADPVDRVKTTLHELQF